MEWKLEVVVIPVSDADRAKEFYSEKVGFDGPGGPWNTFFFFKDPDGNSWAVQEKPMA